MPRTPRTCSPTWRRRSTQLADERGAGRGNARLTRQRRRREGRSRHLRPLRSPTDAATRHDLRLLGLRPSRRQVARPVPGVLEWNSLAEERAPARGPARSGATRRSAAAGGRTATPSRRRCGPRTPHPDGHRRTRPSPGRRSRARIARADRWLAGDRQVHAHDDGARAAPGRGPHDALRQRRGVGGADPASRRASRRRRRAGFARHPGARRDRSRQRACGARGGAPGRLRDRLGADARRRRTSAAPPGPWARCARSRRA